MTTRPFSEVGSKARTMSGLVPLVRGCSGPCMRPSRWSPITVATCWPVNVVSGGVSRTRVRGLSDVCGYLPPALLWHECGDIDDVRRVALNRPRCRLTNEYCVGNPIQYPEVIRTRYECPIRQQQVEVG